MPRRRVVYTEKRRVDRRRERSASDARTSSTPCPSLSNASRSSLTPLFALALASFTARENRPATASALNASITRDAHDAAPPPPPAWVKRS
eukprot:30598-Pelagococcus_subviridis.AAC.1